MSKPEAASARESGTAGHNRLAFTKLSVADLERSREFYVRALGMREKARYGRPDLLEVELALSGDAAETTLVLMQWVPARKPVVGDEHGRLGIVTSDIRGLFARARAAGAAVTEDVRELREHGVWIGFLADPDGYAIEVVQPLTA
jgi:lactoylglutathione lyase